MKITIPKRLVIEACLLFGACIGVNVAANAGAPAELVDIRIDTTGSGPSDPRALTDAGSRLYFSAIDGVHGRELWTTDGTPGGTYMVKDIWQGPQSSWADPGLVFDGRYFFTGVNDSGGELWVSDGTEEGTQLLIDLWPGISSSAPTDFVTLNETLFFFANNGRSSAKSLFRSDGTAIGTSLVMDFGGRASRTSPPVVPTHYRDGIVFLRHATDEPDPTQAQIWFTDGTTPGTEMIAAFDFVYTVGVVGETLVIFARDATHGWGIFSSTGPGDGVQWVAEMFGVSELAHTGDALLFYGSDTGFGAALWRTDGTTAGTEVVKDLRTVSPGQGFPHNFVQFGQRHYFLMDGDNGGLWVSDGTQAGTFQVFEFADLGSGATDINDLRVAGDSLFFVAQEAATGAEMWRTDGTLAGTAPLDDIAPGSAWSQGSSNFLNERAVLNDRLVFVADDGIHGRELWQSGADGKSAALLKDIRPQHGSRPEQLTPVGDAVFFVASDGVSGRNVWRSDGTTLATAPVANVLGDTQTRYIQGQVFPRLTIQSVAGADVYFSMRDQFSVSSGRTDLWITRGANGVTQFLAQFLATGRSSVTLGTLGDGSQLFRGQDEMAGRELWRSDGTPEGTGLFVDILPGSSSSSPSGFGFFAGNAYFSASTSDYGSELWRSDGTVAGTTLVKDINPGAGSVVPFGFASTDNLLYFNLRPSITATETEVWRSDGTAEGTFMVRDINPNGDSSPSSSKVAIGSVVYFVANDAVHGFELWRSEGDEASTYQVADIFPGSDSAIPRKVTVFGDTLVFFATDGVHGRELWRSDGTLAGTGMVRDIWPGPGGSRPDGIAVHEDFVLFAANDGAGGRGIWLSDTTRSGTWRLADIRPLPAMSNPTHLTVAGDSLFFSANHETAGIELWRLGGLDDVDDDGAPNRSDNCFVASNVLQSDTDADGFGNACDADFNQDCVVNTIDLGMFRLAFSTTSALYDLNEDGVVGVQDLGVFKRLYFAPPGPATPGSSCEAS